MAFASPTRSRHTLSATTIMGHRKHGSGVAATNNTPLSTDSITLVQTPSSTETLKPKIIRDHMAGSIHPHSSFRYNDNGRYFTQEPSKPVVIFHDYTSQRIPTPDLLKPTLNKPVVQDTQTTALPSNQTKASRASDLSQLTGCTHSRDKPLQLPNSTSKPSKKSLTKNPANSKSSKPTKHNHILYKVDNNSQIHIPNQVLHKHAHKKGPTNIWNFIDTYPSLATKLLSSKKEMVAAQIIRAHETKMHARHARECRQLDEANQKVLNEVMQRRIDIDDCLIKKVDGMSEEVREAVVKDLATRYPLREAKIRRKMDHANQSVQNRHKSVSVHHVAIKSKSDQPEHQLRTIQNVNKLMHVGQHGMRDQANKAETKSSLRRILHSVSDSNLPVKIQSAQIKKNEGVMQQSKEPRSPARVLPAWGINGVYDSDTASLVPDENRSFENAIKHDRQSTLSLNVDNTLKLANEDCRLSLVDGSVIDSSPLNSDKKEHKVDDVASQLDLFVANTQRSEKVAKAFLSLDHSAEHNSGGSELTLDIRAQYVQFRDELQSKIVQLMAMYNSFSQYIDDVVDEEQMRREKIQRDGS
ncbi:hypothetical protein BDEG_20422 [Batrachochytrium dendrobatidis JEL423]|nr:hypothetical protein BDEG_20422 [Batrachochytrium dendrobatidis JEL423]